MSDIEKLRKKLKKEIDETFTVDENSDYPIHERHVKESDIMNMKKKKR